MRNFERLERNSTPSPRLFWIGLPCDKPSLNLLRPQRATPEAQISLSIISNCLFPLPYSLLPSTLILTTALIATVSSLFVTHLNRLSPFSRISSLSTLQKKKKKSLIQIRPAFSRHSTRPSEQSRSRKLRSILLKNCSTLRTALHNTVVLARTHDT